MDSNLQVYETLRNKRILIPREKGQAMKYRPFFQAVGAIPVEIPLLAFRAKKVSGYEQVQLDNLLDNDWIIFTSHVTIETCAELIDMPSMKNKIKIAVIGSKTAASLEKYGLTAQFIPDTFVAEKFVEQFLTVIKENEKVFIPKGNLARSIIRTTLEEKGIDVSEMIVYETYFPENYALQLRDALAGNNIDINLFTSPSTVNHFMSVVNKYQLDSKIIDIVNVSIGPITTKKIKEFGLTCHVEPEIYTVDEAFKALSHFLKDK